MVKQINLQEEEEEKENLPLITTKVVEYLQPIMCRELLCKFPDNSAFGFDYSQSSLWSPLLPRNYASPSYLESDNGVVCRNLELGKFQEENKKMMKKSKKAMKKKSKLVNLSSMKDEHPPKIGCFPIPNKGWDGMLKAASKHFKKSKKKRDPVADVKLLSFFKCSD